MCLSAVVTLGDPKIRLRAEGRAWEPKWNAVAAPGESPAREQAPSSRQLCCALPESWLVCLLPGLTAQAQLPLGTPPAIIGKTQK